MDKQIEEQIRAGLSQSMTEETRAADIYRRRAEFAESMGDKETAKLYRHIADEEDKHHLEFEQRRGGGEVVHEKKILKRGIVFRRPKVRRQGLNIFR